MICIKFVEKHTQTDEGLLIKGGTHTQTDVGTLIKVARAAYCTKSTSERQPQISKGVFFSLLSMWILV